MTRQTTLTSAWLSCWLSNAWSASQVDGWRRYNTILVWMSKHTNLSEGENSRPILLHPYRTASHIIEFKLVCSLDPDKWLTGKNIATIVKNLQFRVDQCIHAAIISVMNINTTNRIVIAWRKVYFPPRVHLWTCVCNRVRIIIAIRVAVDGSISAAPMTRCRLACHRFVWYETEGWREDFVAKYFHLGKWETISASKLHFNVLPSRHGSREVDRYCLVTGCCSRIVLTCDNVQILVQYTNSKVCQSNPATIVAVVHFDCVYDT